MKVCLTSDVHDWLPAVPVCDLLIVVGDIGPSWTDQAGKPKIGSQRQWWSHRGSRWIEETPAGKIIIVPGNHDGWITERYTVSMLRRAGVKILHNESYIYQGLKIWGSGNTVVCPDPPQHPNGRWYFEETEDDLSKRWENIPSDTQILLTHQNPHIASLAEDSARHTESASLTQWIEAHPELLLHAWGHEHGLTGVHNISGITSVNVSATDDSGSDYEPFGYVWTFEWDGENVSDLKKVDATFTACRNKYRSPYGVNT